MLFFLLFSSLPLFAQQPYDLLIKNGRIIDGSGNPWYDADLAIAAGKIAAIGTIDETKAKRVLDATGHFVAPGFIDVHTHAEGGIRRIPTADNFLFDGVTSIVTGNCGGSVTDLPAFFEELRGKGISINVATLIGHNSVREAVMGRAQRDPTPEEQQAMEQLVEKGMREGAVGFSTGLIYIPGTYSKTPEVEGMARAAAKYGGIYASHIRDEGLKVVDAINEALHIGRVAMMPVEISHFKISAQKLWGQSHRTIAMIDKARNEGIDVNVDQYPYPASSTNLGILVPSWALADSFEAVKMRLQDPKIRRKIAAETKQSILKKGFKRLDYAYVARCSWDSTLNGKNISQINKLWKRRGTLEHEVQTVLDMIERGGAGMVYHSMSEKDIERIMKYPYTMIASDAGVIEFGSGVPHPRGYGTHARVLGEYVRKKKLLTWEDAIRKMTSLPAQRFRLTDRGLLRPGLWADVVVVDPEKVKDRATFVQPHAYSEGFKYVVVNGEVTIEEGRHTGIRAGRILLGPGAPQESGTSSK